MTSSRTAYHAHYIALTLLAAVAAVYYLYPVSSTPLQYPLSHLPRVIDNWRGQDLPLEQYPFRLPNAPEEMARTYQNGGGLTVTLYVAYFPSQTPDKKLVNYTSRSFHRSAAILDVPIDSRQSYRVNHAVIRSGGERREAFFWYDINHELVPSRYSAVAKLMLRALTQRRDNAAFIMVVYPSHDTSPSASENKATDFVRRLIPVLHARLS